MKNKKIVNIFIIIFVILIVGSFAYYSYVNASDSDVYDIILFWGQSNMAGYSTTEGSMPDGYSEDLYKFSKDTDIDIDILRTTKNESTVNTPLEEENAYIYKYLSNSFSEITKDTRILGDGLDDNEYNDKKMHGLTYNPSTGKLEKYVDGKSSHISIQTTENVNMIPEFCRTYYERTGHKVIAVNGAVGGANIECFLPKDDSNHIIDGTTDYMYEAIKENFTSAVKLAQQKGYNIGGKYWISFQGEDNVGDNTDNQSDKTIKENYQKYFLQVKENFKNDLGISLGAIAETSFTVGNGWATIGVEQIHKTQENIISQNEDIILGSSYSYEHYVPDETNYNLDTFSRKKFTDEAGNKLEYALNNNDINAQKKSNSIAKSYYALELAKKVTCDNTNNTIHFHSAALSQIGRECANNLANSIENGKYANNFEGKKVINEIGTSFDSYSNLSIQCLPEDAGDPFLIKENGKYYLYATNEVWYTSTNLEDWVTRSGWIDKSTIPSDVKITYYWAPEVYKYNNKYYMIFSGVYWPSGTSYPYGQDASYGAIYLAESDSLEDRFKFVKKVDVGLENDETLKNKHDAKYSYIDGSLLFDDDGKCYMYFKSEEDQDIWGIELDPNDNFNKVGTVATRLGLKVSNNWEKNINEGPFCIKNNGKYYLMYSTGEYKNDSYSVGYAISNNPMSGFEKKTTLNPMIYGEMPRYKNDIYEFDSSKYLYGPGHNMILKTADNEMYSVHHVAVFNSGNYEKVSESGNKYNGLNVTKFSKRKLSIDRIGFDASGNLFVDGPSTVQQPIPSGTEINGITYYQLHGNQYSVNVDNSSENTYLKDGMSYLAKTVTTKIATTRTIDITLDKRRDISSVWLYGNGSNLGFNNASIDICINDEYIIKNIDLGNSTCYELKIPYQVENLINEHIKTIKIIANKKLQISEVKLVSASELEYDENCIINFDANGGQTTEVTMIKQIGTQIGNLPIAIRDGYTFIGWYIQKIGGVKISESTYVGGNITYYAQWIANTDTKYVVKHWQQNIDGNADIKNDVNYTLKDTETLEGTTDEIVIPGIKKYTGFTSPDVRKISILGDGSLVVDYYYKRNKYNVVLDKDEGIESVSGADTYYYEQQVTIDAQVKDGYEWKGWTGNVTLESKQNTFGMPTQDIELTATTTKIEREYTITFDSNGGEQPNSQITLKEGTVLGNLPEVTRTGYTFKGWYTEKVDGTRITEQTIVTQDVTYYAQWIPIQYKVILNKDEGIESVSGAGTYNYEQQVTIDAKVKDGYEWKGWTGNATLESKQNTFGMPAQNVELTATTTKIEREYTITFDSNGGEQPNSQITLKEGTTLGKLPEVTRTGYTFKGWYTEKTDGTRVIEQTIVTQDMTYYAQWIPIQYKVILNKDEGIESVSGAGTYNYEQQVTIDAQVKDGYEWKGWTGNVTLESKQNTFGMPTQDIELTATTTKIEREYTITFDSNGGEQPNSQITLKEGTVLGNLPEVTRTGYTFKGWYTEKVDGTRITEQTIVTQDMTYYAQWILSINANKYIVKHWQQNVDGNANQKDNINYTLKDEEELQGTINSQVIPDVKKYIGFTEPEKQTITIEEDEITILNYYYTRNKYKVILNKDEGIENVNGADSYYYEQSVAIEAQVKDGYKWKNWSGSETYSDIKNTFKMPAQNIELTANSEKNKENIDEGKTDIKDDKDELDEKTKDNRNNLNNDETVIDKIIPKAGKNIILIFVVIVIAIINFIVYVKYKKYSDIK